MDLIDRKALIEELEKELEWSSMHPSNASFRAGRMSGLRSAITIVKDVKPTIDAVPVVHGEWKSESGLFFPIYRCSECNYASALGKTKFCPNCGKDMRKGGRVNEV